MSAQHHPITATARAIRLGLFLAAGVAASLGWSGDVHAAESPGAEALQEFRGENKTKDAIQNRFFLKEKRFEIAPVVGYVPNNPMVRRYTGGALLAYHFNEALALGAQVIYSPDLGLDDLKDLTSVLVDIAQSGSDDVNFQQPLDKMTLGATFSLNWAPIYGKINLVGETVLNFDLYGSLGLGMLSIAEYYATYNDDTTTEEVVQLSVPTNKVRVPVNVGLGMDFFLSQSIALKIDARSYIYVDDKPQYDSNEAVTEKRIYNNFIASAGLSIFVPKMKSRITRF